MLKFSNNRFRRAALSLFVVMGLCAGCAQKPADPNAVPEHVDTAQTYASEFSQLQRDANSELGRQILKDSTITEQEILEIQAAYEKCMSELGHIGTDVDSLDGAILIPNVGGDIDERTDEDHQKCTKSTDWGDVQFLFNKILTNPENIPISELMARCLRRHGAVPPDFTSEDYSAAEEEYWNSRSEDDNTLFQDHLNYLRDDGPQIFRDCMDHKIV